MSPMPESRLSRDVGHRDEGLERMLRMIRMIRIIPRARLDSVRNEP